MSATALPAASMSLMTDEERRAYDWCRHYARQRHENFTVASWFLPRALRPHFFALYAFCRWTDDLGDEAEGDRIALLDAWEAELRACFRGERRRPLFIALGRTADTFDLPEEPFLRLIEANRIDQRVQRFDTFDDLLHYCEYSATPVGRMVLGVLGYQDRHRQELADATCIGLQLANFWQDVSVDLEKGRIYLPLEDLARFGYSEAELHRRVVNDAFRRLMRFQVERARQYFARGRRLEAIVHRRVRLDVRLFRLGGEAVLDAIEAADYDVLSRRPRVPRAKKAWLVLSNAVRLRLGI